MPGDPIRPASPGSTDHPAHAGGRPSLTTVPTSDRAFAQLVRRLVAEGVRGPDELATRLRRLFPRVTVRARQLAHEPEAWYVYRDGSWQGDDDLPWWRRTRVPRVELALDGTILAASPAARSLLAIDGSEVRHFSDFVAPEAAGDAQALFEIVRAGAPIDATVRIRPLTGDIIACDLHGRRRDGRMTAWLRLADDIAPEPGVPAGHPALSTEPAEDVVFARYVDETASTLSPPTAGELEVRLHRLYPHARVQATGRTWRVTRDRPRDAGDAPPPGVGDPWWLDPSLPTVTCDTAGLILSANGAALRLLGRSLVGRHWQDVVTPGSAAQVAPILEMIREAGASVSRFRLPAADGSLVEFDSRTDVHGDELVTVMRPVAAGRTAGLAALDTNAPGSPAEA